MPLEKHRTFLHGPKFAQFWRDYINNHEWIEDEHLNVYIDYPYCVSNCLYCNIKPANIHEHEGEWQVYERELIKLIKSFEDILQMRPLGQIAFGGGTASLMSRDCVREIIKIFGPAWNNALTRKMEVHPRDFNDEYIKFLLDEAHINVLSMGIQTFDPESLKAQHRIGINLNDLKRYVDTLEGNGVRCNMDLVALFNGETEHDWEIFRDDMKIVREVFNPTMFFTQVNFATEKRYYEHTLRLRKEIVSYIDQCPEYVMADDARYRKFDIRDVQEYLDTTYFMVKPEFFEYLKSTKLYSTDPRFGNYIGFGGNHYHRAFSLTSEKQTIYTFYNFYKNHWIHELVPTVVPKPGPNDPIPTIQTGKYIIPPYDPEISGPIE